jgi:hypothetical protein
VAAVAEIVAARQDRQRPLGVAGEKTLKEHVGLLMGGIVRSALRGHNIVSIHASSKGGVWKASVIGRHAAWIRMEALKR